MARTSSGSGPARVKPEGQESSVMHEHPSDCVHLYCVPLFLQSKPLPPGQPHTPPVKSLNPWTASLLPPTSGCVLMR